MQRTNKLLLKSLLFGLVLELILYPIFIFLIENPYPFKYITPFLITLPLATTSSCVFFFILHNNTPEDDESNENTPGKEETLGNDIENPKTEKSENKITKTEMTPLLYLY